MAEPTRFETAKPAPDRVLIVEDEENARIGYEALLRRWGYEVLGVPSAEDALARFSEFAPSALIADVELPGEIPLEVGPDKLLIRSSQIFHATHLNQSPRGRLMHHWLYRKVRDGDFRFNWSHYLTPALVTQLTPDQRALLRLGCEDPIAAHYQDEIARERGKVFWSVVKT